MKVSLSAPKWKKKKPRKGNDIKDNLILGVMQPSDKKNSCVQNNIQFFNMKNKQQQMSGICLEVQLLLHMSVFLSKIYFCLI